MLVNIAASVAGRIRAISFLVYRSLVVRDLFLGSLYFSRPDTRVIQIKSLQEGYAMSTDDYSLLTESQISQEVSCPVIGTARAFSR
jgi:hypothetical protein